MPESITPPPNPEIEELLKEYERQEQQDQRSYNPEVPKKASGMAESLIKNSKGVIKTKKQADGVLIFLIVICTLISGFLFSRMSEYSDGVPPAFINKPYLPLK